MNSISQGAQEEGRESEDDIEAEFGNGTAVRSERVFVFYLHFLPFFPVWKALRGGLCTLLRFFPNSNTTNSKFWVDPFDR